jgi:hypothetical protein
MPPKHTGTISWK